MTREKLLLQASSVKQAVCSANTCSQATVDGLKRLLDTKPEKQDVDNGLPKKTKTAKAPTGPTRPTAKRSKLRSVIAVVEVHEDAEEHLGVREKVKLATEVVNAALKGLTDAIKAPAPPKPPRKRSSLSRTPSRQSFQSATPLRIRCANQVAGVPASSSETCHSRRASSGLSTVPGQGVVALATCAREALAFLRRCSSEADNTIQFSPVQVDSGMSALINKLIGLGLDDLATKELRILLKRLCCVQDDRSTDGANSNPKPQTLSDLLVVKEIPKDPARLALLVTSQLQVLRLIAAKRRPATIEAALEHLKLSNPFSPPSLLQRASGDPATAIGEKAARQLESFAQVLQGLVSNSPVDRDAGNKDPHSTLAPHISVEYQLLVLQVRVIWWRTLSHRIDAKKELLGPFSSAIIVFNQSSVWTPSKKHAFCSSACARFLDLLESPSNESPLTIDEVDIQSTKCDISQLIAGSARNASQFSDSLKHLEKCFELAKALGRSQTSTCSILCQILSIQLKCTTAPGAGACSNLERLASALRSDLSGESSELDDLLFRAVQLQRLVLTTLFGATKLKDAGCSTELLEKLNNAAFDYVLEVSQFLNRYLGKCPDSKTSIRQNARYAERKSLAGKVAIPLVESVAGLARTVCVSEAEKWRGLDSSLSSCTLLLAELESPGNDVSTSSLLVPNAQTNWRQLVSGVYWFRFLGLRQQSAPPEQLLKSLLTSIALLDECTLDEQLHGQMCTKLDKLGVLYESMEKWTEARTTYRKSLDAQLAADCMMLAAASMSTKPMNSILGERDELSVWNRTISAFSRTTLKMESKSKQAEVYDRLDMSRSLRGLILEQQLAILESALLDGVLSQGLKAVIQRLADMLLDVYQINVYPIRRMRVTLSLLLAELTVPGILTEETRDRLFCNPFSSLPENFQQDSGLSSYADHLMASIELARSFLEKKPFLETCQRVLNAWKSTIETSPSKLTDYVDNVPCWARQLRMLAEYFGMQGHEVERAETLHMCSLVQEYDSGGSANDLARYQIDLSLQLLELGHSGPASLLLQRAEKHTTTANSRMPAKVQWHLATATYELQAGSFSDYETHLSKAASVLATDPDHSTSGKSATAKLMQVLQNALLSSVQAAGAFSRGLTGEAIFHARWSVKLSYRAWALLEHKANKLSKAKDAQGADSTEDVIESIRALSLADTKQPIISSTKHESLNGSVFWSLVPLLVRRLLYLSSLFEYIGLVAEAQYYIDQASKIADAVQAPSLQSQCLAMTGVLALRRSRLADALEYLTSSIGKARETQTTTFHVRLHLSLHEAHLLERDWQRASLVLQAAESAIEKAETWSLMGSHLVEDKGQNVPIEDHDQFASRLETLAIASEQKGVKVKRKVVQKTSVKARKMETVPMSMAPEINDKSSGLLFQQLRGAIKRRHACQALMQKQIEPAAAVLAEAAKLSQSLDETARQYIWQAQLHLMQGFAELSSNSVLCVLHESSISYPSMLQKPAQEQVEAHGTSPPNKAVKTPKAATKTPAKKGAPRSTTSSTAFSSFKQSFDSMKGLVLRSSLSAASRSLHSISDRLLKSSLMLSTTSCTSSPLGLNPTFALYASELGRCSSAAQELSATQAERLVAQENVLIGSNPYKCENNLASVSSGHVDYATFQREYIDIVPHDWTVVSISLSEGRDELRLSKLRRGQPPFIVMVPLNRHNSRDADEEIFGFDQGKAELAKIIELANYSTHDERDFSQKGAKTEWWEARAALDARLQDLLVNVENIWLGGFRGLFGSQHLHRHLLARFKESFGRILDAHVPSRRRIGRVGKNAIATRVELDPQVLELIVGLGNPNEVDDLDEPLLDLLYFVIDILQFHGEHNAYDEIDFDSITVETLDALRQYHQALFQESQTEPQNHTILILDKAVHAFPWESLPCLKGQPVTRLPSLVHLRSRILDMRKQSSNRSSEAAAGFLADSQNTGCILNPSADLASTESIFFPHLTSLPCTSPNPTQIIHRSPSAAEFQTALTSHSILLYFGHGSGGQYIRSRTIQKLEHCAVALLLGCSSAKLVEEGEYEPHGVVSSYLAAGAPAVVGTLWDVTDKDIDRWSLDCLERWGLFQEEKRPVLESPTKKSRGRGKGKALESGMALGRTESKVRSLEEGGAEGLRGVEAKGRVSLDQAVALARDRCLMKYLNGAAPVVYGIPVYLS